MGLFGDHAREQSGYAPGYSPTLAGRVVDENGDIVERHGRLVHGSNGEGVILDADRYDTRDPLHIACACRDCGSLVLLEQWAIDKHDDSHVRVTIRREGVTVTSDDPNFGAPV